MRDDQDGPSATHDRPLELGPSGRLRAVLKIIAVASGVLALAVALVLVFGREAASTFGFLPIQLAAGLAPLAVVSLRTTVQVDDAGIRIIGGSRIARGDWTWDDLLEVALMRQGGVWTLGVRPRGSQWDQPGPTAPAIVQPPMKDRATREQTQRALRSWCATRGLLFTETAVGLESPPPGSPLRGRSTSA